MVQVLRRVNVQCEMLQRSQVLEGLGFPSPLSLHSRSRLAVGKEMLARHSWACCMVDGCPDSHSRTWLSSGDVSVSSLVAQSAISDKQTLLRCFSSIPHLPGIHSLLSTRKHCCLVHGNTGSRLCLCLAVSHCNHMPITTGVFCLLKSILGRAHWGGLLLTVISTCHSLCWGSFAWCQGTRR